MAYSRRVDEAFQFAHDLHRGQTRKGVAIPYITHLLIVAGTVGDYGGTEDQVIAALLHDAAEDQGGHATLRVIRERFGDAVADGVAACTDTYTTPKPPWRARKEAFVARTRHAAQEHRLVIAADKLHNSRALLRDHAALGSAIWDRFSAPKSDTLWYHDAICEALAHGWEHPILDELRDVVSSLRRLA
jgi:(p)ppGpp synthase/HD superfamily hydrolase